MLSSLFAKVTFSLVVLLLLGFFEAPLLVFSLLVLGGVFLSGLSWAWLIVVFVVIVLLNIPVLRENIISVQVMRILRALNLMP